MGKSKSELNLDPQRLTKLFANELGYPIRGNKVFSWVEITAAAISILVFIGGVLQLFGQEAVWSTLLVLWLLLLASALIGLVVIQERRVARRVRYAVATEASHGAEHHIRDAEAAILNRDATIDETVPLVSAALTDVARTFTLITGSPCRSCIKEVHYPEDVKKPVTGRTLRELRVSTLCRDSGGGPPSPSDSQEHFVSDNTDFEVLFLKRWKHRWFMSNDLLAEDHYKNSSWTADRPRDYRSTCVWPIQKMDDTSKGIHDTLGFLCVDSLDVDIFDRRFDFNVGAAMADSLYPLLRLMRLREQGMQFAATPSGGSCEVPVPDTPEEARSARDG